MSDSRALAYACTEVILDLGQTVAAHNDYSSARQNSLAAAASHNEEWEITGQGR